MSRLIRPSSSSSPQSPQVEPAGRCVHRLRHVSYSFSRRRRPPLLCTDRLVYSRCAASRALRGFCRTDDRQEHTWPTSPLSSPPTATSSSRPTCSRPGCPRTCGTAGCGRRTSRSSPSSRAGPGSSACCTRPASTGWTISRYRQTSGRMPEGDPEMIIEDMALDGVDVGVMHPNLSLFGLYSDDHELSMAHARVYNDYIIERFSPYFSRLAPTAPDPAHRHRRRGGRDRAGRRRRLPGDPAAGRAAEALLLARLRPGVGGGPGQRRARLHPHPDRRGEGQRPRVDHAEGRHGERRAGQPADDREVGRRSG